MAKMNFGGTEENVVTREEFPLEKAQEVLKDETVAVLGYGVQGPGQALNMKDNGINVIIGQRKGSASWDKIKPHLTAGKALYFSHGFSIVYKDRTNIIPAEDIDVILVAPKGPGGKVREHFLNGKGVNSSYAIHQDATGRAKDRALALGIAVGSGFLFETNFKNEVYSDLTGERGVLMGAIAGLMEAQFNLLRSKGHSPSEAFNETVEEATQSLYPLIGDKGMDWMFANCSTTAQRGALDWRHKFRDATAPVFEELYESVANGTETQITLDANSDADYKAKLNKELEEMASQEIWQAGKTVRSLRPEND